MTLDATRLEALAREYQALLLNEQTVTLAQAESYRKELGDLDRVYMQARAVPSRPITIPAIFGRSYRENFISDYLAYVLDPRKNGIGTAPLARFLELGKCDPDDVPLGEVIIHREYPAGTGRIDLLLEWDTLVVGIENKILSTENAGQTCYYAAEIPRQFQDTKHCFVYLTRGGHPAKSKKFAPVSYSQLRDALRSVSVTPGTGARQMVLWYDFLEHLEAYITMDNPQQFTFSEKAQLYIKHQPMLNDLETAFKEEWSSAIDYLERELHKRLPLGWETAFNRTRYTWHLVTKPAWRTVNVNVSYYYFLSAAHLNRQEILFVLDAEGKRPKGFLDRFEKRSSALEQAYRARKLAYRPRVRTKAIAWKKYPISQNIDEILEVLVEAFEEFSFLESEVDAVLAAMSS